MQESEMELLLLSSILLVIFLILSITLIRILCSRPKTQPELPPGQTGWPVVGETLEFYSTARNGTPENFFNSRMNRYSPEIFKTSLVGEKTAVLCGAAGNKFLFSNENKLVTMWWPPYLEKIFHASVLGSSTRKQLAGILKPDSLQKYVGIMDSIAKKHLQSHWNSSAITVLPLAKQYTFAVGCRMFLGIDDPNRIARFEKPFYRLSAGILTIPINLPGTRFNRAIRGANSMKKEVLEIIKQRKREKETTNNNDGDILAHMLTVTATDIENGTELINSEPEVVVADKIIALLLGGHDTVSSVITFIIKYLSEQPEIYDNVLKEQREIAEGKAAAGEVLLNWDDLQKMQYSWNVVREVMRLVPPVQGSFRQAISDFTYAGFSIPKGWKLHWNVTTTHKNPDYFREPEKFDPRRFEKDIIPYSYVPFGGGPRMCPGKEYARVEILVFMHNLVTKYRWERVLPHEKIVVDPLSMPANGLPVRMHHHSSYSN